MAEFRVDAESQLVAKPPLHPASFDKLDPNRLESVFLYLERFPDDYRYKLTIVDRPLLPTTNLVYHTAVFLIPAGRETEYMFRSKLGLLQIAESAHTARLIAVSFGRQHTFESQSQEAVQQELVVCVQVLSRQGQFLPIFHSKLRQQQTIPFLALDGLGQRNVLARGETGHSGEYIVEQVQAEGRTLRRLYFLDNPFVIQTEVALKDDASEESAVVDKAHAAFEYHSVMAAGILALTQGDETVSGLIVGLGGGGLVNLLHHLRPHPLTAIELDPAMVDVAARYFGVTVLKEDGEPSQGVAVRVGNGLNLCSLDDDEKASVSGAIALPPASLSYLVIDVDSKDKTVGMSCPPVAFVETAYLQQIAKLLKPDGVLVINVSARDRNVLQVVCENVQQVFPVVLLSGKGEDGESTGEDLNVVVFGLASEPDLSLLEDRIDKKLQSNGTDNELVSDLKLSLEGIRTWTPEAEPENKGKATKRKPKKRNKTKKRK